MLHKPREAEEACEVTDGCIWLDQNYSSIAGLFETSLSKSTFKSLYYLLKVLKIVYIYENRQFVPKPFPYGAASCAEMKHFSFTDVSAQACLSDSVFEIPDTHPTSNEIFIARYLARTKALRIQVTISSKAFKNNL